MKKFLGYLSKVYPLFGAVGFCYNNNHILREKKDEY